MRGSRSTWLAPILVAAFAACGGGPLGGARPDAATDGRGHDAAAGTSGAAACVTGQEAYKALRTQLIEQYGDQACEQDTDCALVFDDNACVSTCGFVVPTALAETALSNLQAVSATGCGTCPTPFALPCPFQVAFCSDGRCTSGGPR